MKLRHSCELDHLSIRWLDMWCLAWSAPGPILGRSTHSLMLAGSALSQTFAGSAPSLMLAGSSPSIMLVWSAPSPIIAGFIG